MTRAQETANLILKQLPKSELIKREDCRMLEEGAVCKPSKKIYIFIKVKSKHFKIIILIYSSRD